MNLQVVVEGRKVLMVVEIVESIEELISVQYCAVRDMFIVILIRFVGVRLGLLEFVTLDMFVKVKWDE